MLLRFIKIIGAAILGFAMLIFGLVCLITGIADHRLVPIVAGGVALAGVICTVACVMLRSRREARAAVAVAVEKARAGRRTCWRCKMDFDEATAPSTPKPWHHTALAIALSLVPIGFGALGFWAYSTPSSASPESVFRSIQLLFILAIGVGFLVYAIKGSNRRYVRCPKCGRPCGSMEAAPPRGLPVEPRPPEGEA